MTFERIGKGRYLAAGKGKSGYEITNAGWWCLYRLENIENPMSAVRLGEFQYLNEARKFARAHDADQPEGEEF